jgi:hypothetical protein
MGLADDRAVDHCQDAFWVIGLATLIKVALFGELLTDLTQAHSLVR